MNMEEIQTPIGMKEGEAPLASSFSVASTEAPQLFVPLTLWEASP